MGIKIVILIIVGLSTGLFVNYIIGAFDEFKKGATAKSLEEIFEVADAIMV